MLPKKPFNKHKRPREYLLPEEVELMINAAIKNKRLGQRNQAIIMLAYRHGLRISEITDIKIQNINFINNTIYIERKKNGTPSIHEINLDEMIVIKKYLNTKLRKKHTGDYFFISEKMTKLAVRSVYDIIVKIAIDANIPIAVHPHMLRHSTGYKLVNTAKDIRLIQGYLGHKNIQHTVLYTQLDTNRFKGMWSDDVISLIK